MEVVQQDGGRFNISFPGIQEQIRLEKARKEKTKIAPMYRDMKLDHQKYVQLSLKGSISADTPELISRIKMSDNPEELATLIGDNIDALVAYIYNSVDGDQNIEVLYNLKAVQAMAEKFKQIKQVNGYTQYYLNTLLFHILNVTPDIGDLELGVYRGLIYELNKETIQRLQRNNHKDGIKKSLSVKDATYIAMCRYSCPINFQLRGVERVNFAIANFDDGEDVYTEQMLVYIYEDLFENVTPLFLGTMYKCLEFINEYPTSNQQVLWNEVNAVLSILNFQEYDVITHTLYEFAQKFITHYESDPSWMIRPFRSIPLENYPLICRCINTLHRAGVDMP